MAGKLEMPGLDKIFGLLMFSFLAIWLVGTVFNFGTKTWTGLTKTSTITFFVLVMISAVVVLVFVVMQKAIGTSKIEIARHVILLAIVVGILYFIFTKVLQTNLIQGMAYQVYRGVNAFVPIG